MSDFNEWSDELRPTDFDRMVDGELSLAELRAMIATLDQNPHQWRQCALAFLEDQAFRLELSQGPLDDDLASCFVDRPQAGESHPERDARATNLPSGGEIDGPLSAASPTEFNSHPDLAKPAQENLSPSSGEVTSAQKFMNGHRFSKQLLSAMSAAENAPAAENAREEPVPADDRNIAFNLVEAGGKLTEAGGNLTEGGAVSPVMNQVSPRSGSETRKGGTRPSGRNRLVWVQRIAVAASLLLAFVVGIAGRAWLDPANSESRSSAGRGGELGASAEADSIKPRNDATTLVGGEAPNPSGHVRFDIGDENAADPEGKIPAMEVPFYAEDALPAPAALGLDSDVKRQLEQSGVKVRSKRQVVSLRTEDGRTVLVPLETLEFVPRNSRRFQ